MWVLVLTVTVALVTDNLGQTDLVDGKTDNYDYERNPFILSCQNELTYFAFSLIFDAFMAKMHC